MRGLRSFVMLSLLALPICAATSLYRIEITPKSQNDIYRMRINDAITFQAESIKTNAETGGESQARIDRVWWDFDKNTLIRIASANSSITLKAINKGASQLSVRVITNNYSLIKTVTVLVEEPGK